MASKPKTQTVSSQATVPDFIKPQYEQAAGAAQNIYNDPSNQAIYQGQTFAPFSSQTQGALDAIQQRATNGSPIQAAGNSEFLKTINGDYLNPSSNPYLQDTINLANQNTLQNFQTSVIPGLQSTFSLGGRYGSGNQQGAFSDASRNLLQQTSNNATTIAGQNYSNERTNQLNATLNAPNFALNDYADSAALAGVGQAYDTQNQNQINQDMSNFYATRDAGSTALDQYIARLQGLTPTNASGSNGTQTTPGNSALQNGIGLATSAAGIAALFSDINLKENIVKIGSEKGHNIYEFNYIGEPERYRGVMAQEVKKIKPDAVIETPQGLKVDYNMIGINFERVQ